MNGPYGFYQFLTRPGIEQALSWSSTGAELCCFICIVCMSAISC